MSVINFANKEGRVMNKVDHQVEKKRFILSKDSHECVLDYTLVESMDKSVIDFTHTYVPFALRGQGLAEQLVLVGLEWAKEHDYHMEASCSYVKKFL
jgi:predicted GNAT family acetyltransferase